MTPLRSAAPSFDRLASPYRLLEYLSFGHALERARLHFLPRLLPHRRALLLGDGDGRFCAALLAANPHLRADAVDLSPSMLRLLARRTRAAHPTAGNRLHTHAVDALTLALPPGQTFDLVATHFFLDCLSQPELERLCLRVAPYLAPDTTWVFSDFRIPPGPLRPPARSLIRLLYLAFRIFTGLRTTRLPDHATFLTRLGFVRIAEHHALGGILTSELWQRTSHVPPSQPHRSTLFPMLPPQHVYTAADRIPKDPVPDPEPASPSLPEPDPGVYHHDPEPSFPPPAREG